MKGYEILQKIVRNNNVIKHIKRDLEDGKSLKIAAFTGSFYSFFIKELNYQLKKGFVFVFKNEEEAEKIKEDLENMGEKPIYIPPLFSNFYSTSSINKERIRALYELLLDKNKKKIVILTLKSLTTFIPLKEQLEKLKITLKVGDTIDTEKLKFSLSKMGYDRVSRVSMEGEYRILGEVLDIFLKGHSNPIRIVFEYDNIHSIRKYNILSQISADEFEEIIIYPDKEIIWSEMDENLFDGAEEIFKSIMEKNPEVEEELYYPLVFKKDSILDYIENREVFLICKDELEIEYKRLKEECVLHYDKVLDKLKIIPPEKVLVDLFEIEEKLYKTHEFYLLENPKETYKIEFENVKEYLSNVPLLKEDLKQYAEYGNKIFIFTNSTDMKVKIDFILKNELSSSSLEGKLFTFFEPLYKGFILKNENIVVMEASEIFKKKKYFDKSNIETKEIKTQFDVEVNDFVVHFKYGIGKFLGINRIQVKDREVDYIKILYKDDESVLIPLDQLNFIEKYVSGGRTPVLDKIGSKSWEGKKNKVLQNIKEMTDKLMGLYASRINTKGFAFSKDGALQYEFEAEFLYEETPDQIKSLKEVKEDMEKSYPMDRLVCGDVGFGKTEIALRAAFKAIVDKKQVVFLSPTTVLSEQHFKTASSRMKNFGIRIEVLTRFTEPKKQKTILKDLRDGNIDLIIGTHKILQKGVEFASLGLVVIDEEQKFGVKDKERLKEIKINVDSLSLSATPIPRTLYMSLSGIRDISRIETPPFNRKAIETHVLAYDDEKVKEAIEFEIERGGQVFFLHNRISSLDLTKNHLKNLIPDLLVECVHGQMEAEELEKIMGSFVNGEFQVLLTTTIIENGIDIPNANTIIIERAESLGLSQIHQLRGRVGRSERMGYAYLFYDKNEILSENSVKRLKAISENTSLGSGYKIAMMDMEIRGTGDLFGKEQSGDVASIGFDMYMRLLEERVRERKGEIKMEAETLLDISYSGFIPSEYIENTSEKIEIYRKISSTKKRTDLEELIGEIKSRFGDKIPETMQKLFLVSILKIISNRLKIASIRESAEEIRIDFKKINLLNLEKISSFIQMKTISFNDKKPSELILKTKEKEKLEQLIAVLNEIGDLDMDEIAV